MNITVITENAEGYDVAEVNENADTVTEAISMVAGRLFTRNRQAAHEDCRYVAVQETVNANPGAPFGSWDLI